MSELMTERLVLRPIRESDFDDVCEYGSDEETGQYMLYWPKTKEQIRSFISERADAMKGENPAWLEFAMELRTSGKVMGNISLILNNHAAEIGWLSNRRYWNQGYMSEAVRAVIDYAFETLHIAGIVATCTARNIASYRVMEKCGMQRVGEAEHQAVKDGKDVTYTLLTYCIGRT